MKPLPAISIQAVGAPVALSGLARLLLALHQAENPPPAPLALVPTPTTCDDEPSRPVPALQP